jgi:hypothetical protein
MASVLPPVPPPDGSQPSLGPAVPPDMPDGPPFRVMHIRELADTNGLGEVIILVNGWWPEARPKIDEMVTVMLAVNPRAGSVTRAAVLRPYLGSGFVAIDVATLPGNLRDIAGTIGRERESAG